MPYRALPLGQRIQLERVDENQMMESGGRIEGSKINGGKIKGGLKVIVKDECTYFATSTA